MINAEKWYSLQDIQRYGFIPMLSIYMLKRWIEKGRIKGNSVGQGNGKRYFVKGSNIIQFLAKWDAGDFHS